jgi:PAS domain S-box-containing protein
MFSLRKAMTSSCAWLRAFVLAALVTIFPTWATADTVLDNWRVKAEQVRGLAENDIPAAYKEALQLQSTLPSSASSTDQVQVLNLLSRIEVYLGEAATAERHAKEAFDLALQSDDRAGQAEADLNDALNSVNQGRFDAMSEAVKHSMSILTDVDRPDLLGEAMLRTSMMFRRFERFDDSVEVAMHAMDIAKRSNIPTVLVYAYQGMAIAYDFSGHQTEARDYYSKMRSAAQDAHSRLQEGDALIGLGSSLTAIGEAKNGEQMIREGILLYRKASAPYHLAHAQYLRTVNLRKQGRLVEAQTSISETVSIYERKSNKDGLWWALNLRSLNSRELGRIAEARADTDRAYKVAVAIGHSPYLSESERMQAMTAAEAGDFERAYRRSVEATELSAKSAREKASFLMLDLATRYESESHQRQIKELIRSNEMNALHQRWLWTLLVGSFALLIVSVLFLLRLRRSREEVRKLNIGLEQRVLERTVELRQNQQWLAEAQRISHVGSWEYDIARDKHIWSDELFRIYEIDPAMQEASYRGRIDSIHPDDSEAFERAYFEARRTGAPYQSEHRLLCADGRIKHVFERGETFCSAFGSQLYMVGMIQDITERKQMEAELRASHDFLDSVIDSVSDPIFVKDRQHSWTLLNEAFCSFIGHPREALIGKSDFDFFSKEQADVFWEKDELVFNSEICNLNEEKFTSSNGEEHYIQTKKTPFASHDGRQMLVGVIRDITDRKHYEEAREVALAEAQRLANLRSEFIAHMSHELRTPLNGILGYAQILARDGKLDEKQQASVAVINHSGEHLLALIEDILDLARIESGRLELDIYDFQLATFIDIVIGIIDVRARQKNLEFACEFTPDLPQCVRGDEKRLRQVLLNLLSNAVKFTDRGKVTFSVRRVTPSRLAFVVADTGIGIASSDQETIFRSFEQVSDAQHRTGGTGLGLSISRQLVRLMGGDIEVNSRSGYGSTFRFELELPEVCIEPEVLRAFSFGARNIEPVTTDELTQLLVAPPQEEMQAIHRLAQLGNMRDIARYADHIGGIDPLYRPFAEHLKRQAASYQSKAILAFVEGYLK